MLVRELPDWIDTFLEYTERVLAPKHFRKWTAYSILSGVVERRIWSMVSGKTCFPNLFILLVAQPGVGKTVSIDEAIKMWVGCQRIRLAPSGMTKAAFIDHINEKSHDFSYNGSSYRYHTLCVASGEFGILLPDYETSFLNVLNDMYDCRDLFEDRTRKDGHKIVERPHLNLIAGTQPAYLKHILPETAFGMGFTARIIMVYGADAVEDDMFAAYMEKGHLKQKLISDLRIIQKLVGPMEPTPEAREFIEDWYRNRKKSAPTHSLLQNYNVRRHLHAQKLAMLSSISRSNELVIEIEDYKSAIDILLKAEDDMPSIFKEMAASEDKKEIEEIHRYCYEYIASKGGETVPEQDLLAFIHERVPVHRTEFFMKALEDSGRIQMAGANIPGRRQFKPGAPERLRR